MKVILDELYVDEFFNNGGKVLLNDGTVIEDKHTFGKAMKDKENLSKIRDCTIGLNHYDYKPEDYEFRFSDYRKFLSPKDPYGIKNVNFTAIDRDDSRWNCFMKQRLENGFDESETWSLDSTIARFIYPRLKCFYNDGDIFSHPGNLSSEEWEQIVEKMVKAFELIVTVEDLKRTKEENAIIDEGLDLFKEYFFDLWN